MGEPTTVREATIALLRHHRMTTIFGNPGSTELPMFRDLPDDFRYVLGLQESVVVSMADGYAQATRRAAVVNLHSAIGVGHAMGSIFTAYRNRTPLVVTAGQQARELLAGEPYLFSEDPAALPRPYVKWSREPARAEDVPGAIARAYHVAMSPPRGPVLVSIPVDDWDRPAEHVPPRRVSQVVRAAEAEVAELGAALAGARRPAFVVGALVDQELAFADTVRLAEMHQARVWAAPMSSRCSFPESHPLFAGFLPPARSGLRDCLDGCDLVVVLGAPVFTYRLPGEGRYLPDGARLWQLTDDPQQAAWTPVGTSLVTSIAPAVAELLAYPPASPRPAPPRRARPAPVRAGGAITVELLMQTLHRLRPPGSIIVEEAPSSRPVMCEYLPNDAPESFFTCASGGLGLGLPSAVGMLLGRPDRRVIAVIGDGSMMYGIQALWSAARIDNAPMTVVVVNNGGYATVRHFAQLLGMDKPVGADLPGLDFSGLARAQGCRGARVSGADDLPAMLGEALASEVPYVLDVVVA
ncbi:benzoylformate decarboxylase [Micromonospora sp. WMMD712]|uniref:benzoylformate decarboxylase n=1 Tax=Micromonospora sp. WMMD712 TaxID=3016096 RepID=UPI00249BC14E|nr:benzoylformate decarboxylase [Micromonospora sp. WMMD712]WFE60211.1 benzoylformate decarboxylase [Micromonospora sp. WMMD712]